MREVAQGSHSGHGRSLRWLRSRRAAVLLALIAIIGAAAEKCDATIPEKQGGMRSDRAGERLAGAFGCSERRLVNAPAYIMVKNEGLHAEKARWVPRGKTSQWLLEGYRIRYWCPPKKR